MSTDTIEERLAAVEATMNMLILRLDDLTSDMRKVLNDHEDRLRSQDRRIWTITVVVAFFSALLGAGVSDVIRVLLL